MAQLPKSFDALQWEPGIPDEPEASRVALVWMPADLIELYREAFHMLKCLENLGVKKWPQYKAALLMHKAERASE